MAQNSWPDPDYNAGAVTDAEYEKLAARFSDDGIDGSPVDTQIVTAGAGLQVSVRSGATGSVRGFYWESGGSSYTHSIASNTSGSTRVDRVVLRFTRSTTEVRTVIRQGTPGSGAPALVQDPPGSGVWEIPIAHVTIANNASSVTVTRGEQYIGTRVRPCTSSTRPGTARRGEVVFETDTGKWMGWSGTDWATVYEYSGEVTLPLGAGAWENLGSVGWKRNGIVTLRLSLKRISSTFTTTDSDGSHLVTVPAALRHGTHYQFYTGISTNGALGRIEVRPDGEVWMKELTANIVVNSVVAISMCYTQAAS